MGETETVNRPYLSTLLVALVLALLTLSVYHPVGRNEFVHFDDPLYVSDNPYIKAGLNARTFRWSLTAVNVGNWHPLTMLSLALDETLFGRGPAGFHFTNLFLHIASTVLLFLILRRITGFIWPSAWVAALFALHPLHVESVAWVAERKDVLSGFFWMLTLAAYVYYTSAPSWRRYAWVLLAFALGLMAKPMLVTLPCVLLLLDYWPLRRFRVQGQDSGHPAGFGVAAGQPRPPRCSLRLIILEKLPLLLLAAVCSLIALRTQNPEITLEERPLSLRLEHVVMSYTVYLRKMVWPVDLAPFYPFHGQGWPLWQIGALAGLLLGITALAWRERVRRPYLAVGWLWYLGTLVPVIGLVQVGDQAWADRYTYLPLIGVFIMVAWGATEIATYLWRQVSNASNRLSVPRMPRRRRAGDERPEAQPLLPGPFLVVAVLAAASIILCALLTQAQIYFWHDDQILWNHALEVTSDNDLAHNQLGAYLGRKGEREEARSEYLTAIAINPQNVQAHLNLARGYLSEKSGEQKAIEVLLDALRANPRNAELHAELGRLYFRSRLVDGLDQLRQAIRLDPREAKLHVVLAEGLEKAGDLHGAAQHLVEAVHLAPDAPAFHYYLGAVLCRLGRWQEADATLQQALELARAFDEKGLLEKIDQERARCRRRLRSEGKGAIPPVPDPS
jgi:protein O-mannosyl-transferase